MTDFDDGPDTNPDADKTPVAPPGSCWRCERIDAVFIVAPQPTTIFQFRRLPVCISTRKWAWCAVTLYCRLGEHDLYIGPDRREIDRGPEGAERRHLPPPFPPRQDDKP